MSRSIRTFAICLSVSGLATMAIAQSAAPVKAETAKQETGRDAKPAAPASGMMVGIDPVTKKIRPLEIDEIKALNGSRNPAVTTGVQTTRTIQGPGNSVGIVLDDTSMVFMVATKTADGKLQSDCVTGDKNAKAQVDGVQVTTKKAVLDVQ